MSGIGTGRNDGTCCRDVRCEEVVGAVGFGGHTRDGVADHRGRPVDAPTQALGLADDLLGVELGAVTACRELLAQVEVAFGEHSVVITGHGDRGDVVQHRFLRHRELRHAASAVDVDCALGFFGSGDIVQRSEVNDVIDGTEFGAAEAETVLGDVADDGDHAVAAVDGLHRGGESWKRTGAHENVDPRRSVVGQQSLHYPATDESASAGYEVARHVSRISQIRSDSKCFQIDSAVCSRVGTRFVVVGGGN